MVHPEGRCIQLNFTKTEYLETTLIFKFDNAKFNYSGTLEMTITGIKYSMYTVKDHSEHFGV